MPQHHLQKEKLFSSQLPRSRVQLDIVNRIKNDLKSGINRVKIPSEIITYQKIVREDGGYYIYRNGPNNLTPIKLYLHKSRIKSGDLLDYFIEILTVLKKNSSYNNKIFPQGIKVENIYLSKGKRIFILAENYLDLRKKYAEFEEISPKKHYFIPPEMIFEPKWSEKGYVFNTAAVFYYFFTGRTIFPDKDKAAVLEKIQSEKIMEIKYLNSDISNNLSGFFADMLSRNPEDRPGFDKTVLVLRQIKTNLSINYKVDYDNITRTERRIKLKSLKDNAKLFFRRNWKLLLFFVLIGAGVFWGVSGNHSSIIDKTVSPEEVLNLFYKGIDEKNIQLIEEITTADIGNLERLIVESHVVEKMQLAFEKSSDSSVNFVYDLENLKIKEIMRRRNEVIFRAEYDFKFYRDDYYYTAEMNDKISIKNENNRWKIVMIEGSLAEIAAGNHPWEE